MNLQHPELQEMLRLGCPDPLKVMLAFQSYMHLCEVERLHNVGYFYNSELDLICLSSSDKRGSTLHVPVPAQFSLSPAWLHNINTVLLRDRPGAEVNILLRTPDSTLLPYKLTEGLCPPPTPESTKEKKALQEKVKYVQTELHKLKKDLYEEAKRKRIETCDDLTSGEKKEGVSDTLAKDGANVVSEICEDKKENVIEKSENSTDQSCVQSENIAEASVDMEDVDMDCKVDKSANET